MSARCLVVVFALLPTTLAAQFDEVPKPYVSPKAPTQKEIDQRQSLHFYVLGLLCEREDRLLEALKAYEKAAELDTAAPGVTRAMVPVLLALDRPQEALVQAQKTVDLDAADFETSFILARLYKSGAKFKEALGVLENAGKHPDLKKEPELAQQIYFDLGSIHETEGNSAKAAAAFEQVVEVLDHPDAILEHGPFQRQLIQAKAAETYERIGHLYRKAQKYDDALAAFRKAQERLPEGAGRLNLNLAQVAHEQGNAKDALTYIDNYLRLQPLAMEAYELKITLLTGLKRTGEIVPWLERAVQADRHNIDLKLLLADRHVKAGQPVQAEKLYRATAEEAPRGEIYRGLFKLIGDDSSRGMVEVLFLINKTIGAAAQKEASLAALTQAKAMIGAVREDGALAGQLIDVAFRLRAGEDELNLETLHLLAALADQARKLDEAERFYRRCLPDVTPNMEHLVYGGLLRNLWKAKKYNEVLSVCREGLKNAQATNHLLFYNEMAKAFAQLGKLEEALAEADHAVNLAGDNHVLAVRHLRVRLLIRAEMYERAERECQAMIKEYTQPGDVQEIRYLLSNVYASMKQLDKSAEQLELILQMDPNSASANNDLGYLWADKGKNLDKAEEMVRRAIDADRRQRKLSRELSAEEDHDNAAYIDSLGWVLFRRGQLADARKELERAVALPGGDDPVLWDHLGDVYYRLEMFPDARRAWQTSIRLYETETRRRPDERYHDVQKKLKMVK